MSARHAALLGFLAAVWGSSYLLIKYALRGFSAEEIVFGRAALAALVLVPLCLARAETRSSLRACLRRPGPVLALGALFVAVPFSLISLGETAIPSGLTAILIAFSPIAAGALAPVLDPSERLDRRRWLGLAVGLAGVALLVGVEAVGSLSAFLGSVAMLGAATCYALASFAAKRWFAGVPSVVTSAAGVSSAALLVAPFAVLTARGSAPGPGAIAALAALGPLHTAVAFVAMYALIAGIGPARANLVSYLTPPFALAYGALLLDERVSPAAVGGLVLVLAGVTLASRAGSAAEELPDGGALAGGGDGDPVPDGRGDEVRRPVDEDLARS